MRNVILFPPASGLAGRGTGAAALRTAGQPYVVPRHMPRKLTREQALAFKEIAPAALWIAGNLNGPQQRYWGDNEGAWPVRLGLTQAWNDTASPVMLAAEPFNPRAIMVRLWCDTWEQAETLWLRTYESLKPRFAPARGEWLAFDPETTLGDISAEILNHAAGERIQLLTDDELLREIDSVIAMARKLMPEG